MEGDFPADSVVVGLDAEDLASVGMQHSPFDQLADRPPRLESGVERQPWLGPQQAVLDLALGPDLLVLDVKEALHEGLVVVQDFVKDTERVHDTSR
ncbi:hypothetical protein LAUMK35_00998 [Mycobacterium pseudokansasii]|nr:hypothetical protein LAUMK35_00998 [Mycobacterium pseudokansasii]VAZ90437.1 hypothetical protein LAUMK21_00998 [Mycobacterium pseudokansasii]